MGRFINADDEELLGANGDFSSYNLFAYCGNNPVSRADDGGQFWNIIIGAAAGAVLGAVTQIVSNVINKEEDLLSGVGMAAAVGGIGGAIAATSWSAPVQAIITGVVSGVGDAINQKRATGQVDLMKSIKTGLVAGATSAIGSYAGAKLFKGVEDLGNSLIQKGYSQAAKGVDRALRGLSHTSYYRSGRRALSMGKAIVNVYRGLSSTLGSVIGVAPGLANNLIEPYSP